MDAESSQCNICFDIYDTDNPAEGLMCGHTMHKECLDRFMEVSGHTLEQLRCPTCKKTHADLQAEEARLLAHSDAQPPSPERPPPQSPLGRSLSRAISVRDLEGSDDEAATLQDDMVGGALMVAAPPPTVPAKPKSPTAKKASPMVPAKPKSPTAKKASAPKKAARPPGTAAPPPPNKAAAPSPGTAAPPPPTAAQATAFVGTDVLPKDMGLVVCNECGEACDFENVRLKSKREGTWKCKKCDSKLTTLWRGFGEWPPKEWEQLPIDARRQFMKDLQNKPWKEMKTVVEEKLSGLESHASTYALGGDFLPLGAWAQRGYNAADIEKNSRESDTRTCPVVGMTYRVPIYSVVNKDEYARRREQALGGAKRRKLEQFIAELEAPVVPTEPAEKNDVPVSEVEDSDDEDSDSDSMSSSSSSEKKGKKKDKKKKDKKKARKKEKKERRKKAKKDKREKAKAKAQKEQDKTKEASKKLAGSLLEKLQDVRLKAAVMKVNATHLQLPASAAQILSTSIDEIENMCSQLAKSSSTGEALTFTKEDAMKAKSTFISRERTASAMFAQMAKFNV